MKKCLKCGEELKEKVKGVVLTEDGKWVEVWNEFGHRKDCSEVGKLELEEIQNGNK